MTGNRDCTYQEITSFIDRLSTMYLRKKGMSTTLALPLCPNRRRQSRTNLKK